MRCGARRAHDRTPRSRPDEQRRREPSRILPALPPPLRPARARAERRGDQGEEPRREDRTGEPTAMTDLMKCLRAQCDCEVMLGVMSIEVDDYNANEDRERARITCRHCKHE